MNTTIKIYPDREMLALDMAEALDAATIRSGIIQGCAFSTNTGSLTVTDGRLMIKGRVAVVSSGALETPEVSIVRNDMVVCAVCNLTQNGSGEEGEELEPITLEIVTPEEYSNLERGMSSAEDFNASNGQWVVKLGTVTVAPDGTVSNYKANAAAATPARVNNKAYVDEGDAKVQTAVDKNKTQEESHYNRLVFWRDQHIIKRLHDANKFRTWNITIPHCVLKAGQTKMFSVPHIDYGYNRTYSNGKMVDSWEYPQSKYPKYVEEKDKTYRVRTSIKTFAKYGPRFLTPIGIVGVQVTNSDNGGKNRQRVRLIGWGFGSETCNVTLAMDDDTSDKKYPQAIVDVQLKIQYVQEE